MKPDPPFDGPLRKRALLFIEDNGLSEGAFRDLVDDLDPGMPDRSQFNRFLKGKSRSRTIRRGITKFLSENGYWPEINNMNKVYPVIVDFFGGHTALPEKLVETYCGTYIYYQHSTRYPGQVATSAMTIAKTAPNDDDPSYLVVDERSADTDFEEAFRGVFFRNGQKDVILMRQETSSYGPKLLFCIDKGVSPDGRSWIAGRLLKTSVNQPRFHESNWFARKVLTIDQRDRALDEGQVKNEDETAHVMLYERNFFSER